MQTFLNIELFDLFLYQFYSICTHHKNIEGLLWLREFSCKSGKINEAGYFLFILICAIFRNYCNLITVKSDSKAWISNYINCVRIFANSSTTTYHLFNLIKNFLFQISLIHLWLISNRPDSVITKIIFEKFFIFLDIIEWLLKTLVINILQFTIITQSYV